MSNQFKARKFGQITLDILEYILLSSEAFVYAFNPSDLQRKFRDDDFATSQIMDNLRSLGRRGLITTDNHSKQLSVKITQKGRIKLLENDESKKTDGKWRMLSFDIPEEQRAKRDLFRRSIKRIGFRQVQKSLWACPYVKASEVTLLIDELGIKPYVVYLVVLKTDSEKYLENLFT